MGRMSHIWWSGDPCGRPLGFASSMFWPQFAMVMRSGAPAAHDISDTNATSDTTDTSVTSATNFYAQSLRTTGNRWSPRRYAIWRNHNYRASFQVHRPILEVAYT